MAVADIGKGTEHMKKFLAFILALIMAFTLVACGTPDNSENEVEEQTPPPSEENLEEADPQEESGTYILPDSDKRTLTGEDLESLSNYGLVLARNEIYARHGRIFTDADISAYFESQGWYNGTVTAEEFGNEMLSATERDNVSFIFDYEKTAANSIAANAETELPAITEKNKIIGTDFTALSEKFSLSDTDVSVDKIKSDFGLTNVDDVKFYRVNGTEDYIGIKEDKAVIVASLECADDTAKNVLPEGAFIVKPAKYSYTASDASVSDAFVWKIENGYWAFVPQGESGAYYEKTVKFAVVVTDVAYLSYFA